VQKRLAIVDGIRTPIGNLGGTLREISAQELARIAIAELLKRTNINTQEVEEVILGCCFQSSDAPNIARVSALMAGLPVKIPAYTVLRNCASSMQAVVNAYQNLLAGNADVQIVGGVDSMSNAPYVCRDMRFGKRLRNSEFVDAIWEGLTDPICNQIMGRTAENLAEEFNIAREQQDAYALESHKRAFRATREGKFREEIVPVNVPKKVAGREVGYEVFADDEAINIGLNMQTLSLYPTVFKENGTVTPGNACGMGDAACVLLVMSQEKAKSLGYKPLGYLRSYAFVGLEPHRMGLGPAYATPVALKKVNLTLKDIELIELNEAFAAQVLACFKVLDFKQEIVNVNGGAIALGHPVGFTGARLVLTLLKEMQRRNLTLGLATMCIGGGQGGALILERS
jgi:acetyl-CoA C-acetyltransferase